MENLGMFYVVIELFIIQKCKNQGRDNNFYEALTNPQIYHIHKPHIHKDLKKYFGQKSTSTIKQLIHILLNLLLSQKSMTGHNLDQLLTGCWPHWSYKNDFNNSVNQVKKNPKLKNGSTYNRYRLLKARKYKKETVVSPSTPKYQRNFSWWGLK